MLTYRPILGCKRISKYKRNKFILIILSLVPPNKWLWYPAEGTVPIYLKKEAAIWWEELKPKPVTFRALKQVFLEEFTPRNEARDAKLKLEGLVQREGDRFASYLRTVKHLCSKLDPPMTETEVIRQVKKGLLPSFKKVLIKKPPRTLDEMLRRIQLEEDVRMQDQMNRKNTRKRETKDILEIQAVETAIYSSGKSWRTWKSWSREWHKIWWQTELPGQ